MATAEQRSTAAKRNGSMETSVPRAVLNELGEKIFLDRYALKDMTKRSLTAGDTVIVCVDQKTRQREIGTVRSVDNGRVTVELRDGTVTEQGYRGRRQAARDRASPYDRARSPRHRRRRDRSRPAEAVGGELPLAAG
jgi:hypothetical protein